MMNRKIVKVHFTEEVNMAVPACVSGRRSFQLFCSDIEHVIVGGQSTHSARRSVFIRRYYEWCNERDMQPMGKVKLLSAIRTGCVDGIRLGTDSKGNDVIRGVLLLSDDL